MATTPLSQTAFASINITIEHLRQVLVTYAYDQIDQASASLTNPGRMSQE